MSNIDYKLKKYQEKIDSTKNESKKQTYSLKLNQYKNMKGGELKQGDINPNNSVSETSIVKIGSRTEILRIPTPINPVQYHPQMNQQNNSFNVFGYGAINKYSKLIPVEFDRRQPREKDVVFEIKFCGVCHSDWHVILDEWKNSKYPIVTGHEMTGIVTQVGSGVTRFKVGEKVALSPLYNSCRHCENCNAGYEQYCKNDTTETYNMYDRLPGELKQRGPVTQGGYSNVMVADEYYVFKLPENLPMDRAAPLLCAGTTVYSTILINRMQPGQTLGIVGIGGLGHLLIKIAKAMGIRVIAITTTEWKLGAAKELGADDSVLSKDLEKLEKMKGTLDFIVDTIPFRHDINKNLELLKLFGIYTIVGCFFDIDTDGNEMIREGKVIRGSNIGSIASTTQFLDFCSKHNILPETQTITLDQVNGTRDKLVKSEARFRYVIDIDASMPKNYNH